MRYQITSFDLLKQMLAELDDNPLHCWDAYPCLEWPRYRNPKGYGRIQNSGGHSGYVARLAYELCVGVIPVGYLICHHCDNPPCFRPIHLFPGDDADNMRDCISKGRLTHCDQKGSRNNFAKLTEEHVREIRQLYKEGARQSDLCRMFAISPPVMSTIINGTSWLHV